MRRNRKRTESEPKVEAERDRIRTGRQANPKRTLRYRRAEPAGGAPPRLPPKSKLDAVASNSATSAAIVCDAQAHPAPAFRWDLRPSTRKWPPSAIELAEFLPSFTEFYRMLPSFTEFYRVLLRSTRCYLETCALNSQMTAFRNRVGRIFTEFYRMLPSFPSFTEFHCVLHNFTEFYRVLLRSTRCYLETCALNSKRPCSGIELAEFYRVLPSFTKCYRVLPSFTEFYCVLHNFTEFYRVLTNFTELYRVLLCSTQFYRILPSFIAFQTILPSFTEC